ncbi:hypothetical protein BJX65DRAFT_314634 [Aspergillus insuetus]
MERIGKNSLVTQKAGCCIERMLKAFDTLGAEATTASVTRSSAFPANFWSTDYVMQDIARFSEEL